MSTHVIDRLSAYLDGDLDGAACRAVDEHLRTCEACSDELEALRRLVAYARSIPGHDAPPADDLWPGIERRMTVPAAAAFAPRAGRPVRAAARVSLSFGQLAAAAVLLMAVSGAAAWFVRGGLATGPAPAPVIEAEVEPAPPADLVRRVNFADAQYDAAVADLERALAERRNDLNPRTVEILERNLKLIDAAIAQARQALDEDPGNAYLNRHLVESRRRKLELLRRAAAIDGAN